MHIAKAIVANLAHSIKVPDSSIDHLDSTAPIWQGFTIQVVPPGLIYFQLTEEGQTNWLQYLISQPLDSRQLSNFRSIIANPDRASLSRDSTCIFDLLYTHARCCSLLRLGLREGVIGLSPVQDPGQWLLTDPNPLPWLDLNRNLRCRQPIEQQLVGQLAKTLDELSEVTLLTHLPRSVKVAQALAAHFQAFESTCRIFGETQAAALELAQARLGLVFATQLVLRSLLQDWLGLAAPPEF